MIFDKVERYHSNAELVLAIANKWCEKHQEKPEVCGATKEARVVAGNVLKLSGIALSAVALYKAVK